MKIVRVGFGVGYDRDGKPIEAESAELYIRNVITAASIEYGGCFVAKGTGGWYGPDGLVLESGRVLTVYADIDKREAVRLANFVRASLNQTAVMLEYDGQAEEIN